ncbi:MULTISPECIES: hypothetical protein [Rhizobium/Agrobacterium group]|uniref:hypothetical protein n=1 Tax=Rhizobium/Agrobacterium group TaxID=227290 RepID=UPI0023014BEF|nr:MULTISPECIES: hypothetical protein [Rhizobium/Agrobacterium group]MDA5635975.1 hypothetical protein [Agrobacterium sp. ST15.16.024]MDF1891116.1 hypothetical protein [Rhizobium rhizogenes]
MLDIEHGSFDLNALEQFIPGLKGLEGVPAAEISHKAGVSQATLLQICGHVAAGHCKTIARSLHRYKVTITPSGQIHELLTTQCHAHGCLK